MKNDKGLLEVHRLG